MKPIFFLRAIHWELFLIVLLSCSPSKHLTKNFSLPEILSSLEKKSPEVSTLHGKGSIAIESETESFSGTFEVSIKHSDSLLLRLFGPFGIPGGTLLLTRDSFFLYNVMENRVVISSIHNDAVETLLHFSGDFETFAQLFSHETPTELNEHCLLSLQENNILLSQTNGNELASFLYNTEEENISRYQRSSSNNEIIWEKQFDDFQNVNERSFAFWIRTSFPQEHRSLTISYSTVDFNQEVRCSFSFPKSVEIIRR